MALNIETTVEIQTGTLTAGEQFVASNEPGSVTVVGSIRGAVGREIELTANEASANGYQFKKWIIETIPITKVEVATSMPYLTYDEICIPTRQNTEVSTSYFSDGQFLYEDQEGNRLAPNGFYGIGSGRYYIHDTNTGLRGPLTCGSSNNSSTPTGGGGSNPAQPTGDESDDSFGGIPGGGSGVTPNNDLLTNQI